MNGAGNSAITPRRCLCLPSGSVSPQVPNSEIVNFGFAPEGPIVESFYFQPRQRGVSECGLLGMVLCSHLIHITCMHVTLLPEPYLSPTGQTTTQPLPPTHGQAPFHIFHRSYKSPFKQIVLLGDGMCGSTFAQVGDWGSLLLIQE